MPGSKRSADPRPQLDEALNQSSWAVVKVSGLTCICLVGELLLRCPVELGLVGYGDAVADVWQSDG